VAGMRVRRPDIRTRNRTLPCLRDIRQGEDNPGVQSRRPRRARLFPVLTVLLTLSVLHYIAWGLFLNNLRQNEDYQSGMRVMVVKPNAFSSAPPIVLPRLFGTMMMSLAMIK